MRKAIIPDRARDVQADGDLSFWASLPGLCCQAAGGDPGWVEDLTVAWLMFYAAADIMDSVQDEDPPEAWWAHLGPGVALSAASGLYFTAGRALNALYQHELSKSAATEIVEDFYNSFMVMASGQYRELASDKLSLEGYWATISAKSGAFFALACRSGARLASDNRARLEAFGQFGRHLGLLIQLKDDLDEVRAPQDVGSPGQKPGFGRSLPVIYAQEVLPPEEGSRLRSLIRQAPSNPQAARTAIGLLDRSGAALYLEAEIQRHQEQARAALGRAEPEAPASDKLTDMIGGFQFS